MCAARSVKPRLTLARCDARDVDGRRLAGDGRRPRGLQRENLLLSFGHAVLQLRDLLLPAQVFEQRLAALQGLG